MNKNGNGADHGETEKPRTASEKLIRFPTLAERDRMRKAKEKKDDERPPSGKNAAPFFNFSKIPPFTRITVLAFIAVHVLLNLTLNDTALGQVMFTLGFVPGHFTGSTGEFPFLAMLSPFTYQFLHGSWLHLLINVISMLVMGMFFEKEFGPRAAAFLFFACGLAGAGFYFALNPFSGEPVIGASAGISGLMGAVIILLFQRNNRALHRIQKYGPWPLIVFWVLFMAAMGILSSDSIAWQAHVGGFLGGIGLLHLLQQKIIRFRK